jgi:hypothetical protein
LLRLRFLLVRIGEIITEPPAAVFVFMAVKTEVLPVGAVRRIVVVVPVFVVDGQHVSVLVVELTAALGADEAVNLQ